MPNRCFPRLPNSNVTYVETVDKESVTTMPRMIHLILAPIFGLFCLFLLFQTALSPARAVDLIVLNTNDSGPGSLREVIALASDGDTILFDSSLNGQDIILTTGQLVITKNLTISGPGADLLAVSGNNASRVFSITSVVTISGVTIKDGIVVRDSAGELGGGISNDGGIVNLVNSTVSDNTSVGSLVEPGIGGGISNNGIMNLINSTVSTNTAGWGGGIANRGLMTLTNSTVSSNTGTDSAGGIYNYLGGTVNLTDSTVSNNTGNGIYLYSGVVNLINSTVSSNNLESNDGGGIMNLNGEVNLTNSTVSGNTAARFGGGIYSLGVVDLTNCTVSGNTAGNDGGGIYKATGTTILTNTILAYNQANSVANDCFSLYGAIISGGYNLVQAPGNCVFSATGDITNTDPLLGPLADYGGDTSTHALLHDSLAINHIPQGTNGCGTTITTDQRGVSRPQDAACDIGAYEVDVERYLLTLILDGNGGGAVTSDPSGIDCNASGGGSCIANFIEGMVVTLTATADSGSTFVGWSGNLSGTSNPVTLTITADTLVSATFALAQYELSVALDGAGSGSVTSDPPGIDCASGSGADCTEILDYGTIITLTATAGISSTFVGWNNACTGTGDCIITMDNSKSVTASFGLEHISSVLYVAPDGDCGGGTAIIPCYGSVQAAVEQATDGDEIRVASGIYTDVCVRPRSDITTTGVVTQVVYIDKAITVRGGYTITNWDASNPVAYPTTLNANGQGRVLYITGDVNPTIEGLHITDGDATGMSGDSSIGYDAGGGVYVYNATVTISNCIVYSNTGSTAGSGFGGGLSLNQSKATLSGNTIISNTGSTTDSGRGGGLHFSQSDATLNDNIVRGNTASTVSSGQGGGLFFGESDATLRSNTVRGNIASTGSSGYGGGLHFWNSDATLSDNTVWDNIASTTAGLHSENAGSKLGLKQSTAELCGERVIVIQGEGGGLSFSGGNITLDSNRILSNTGSTVAGGAGGGASLIGSIATLNDNLIYGNTASTSAGLYSGGVGGGLVLYYSTVTLSGNIVQGNTGSTHSIGSGGGLEFLRGDVTLSNNVVQSNTASVIDCGTGGGLAIGANEATLNDNTIISNTTSLNPTADGYGGGLLIWQSHSFTLTNNLVAGNDANTEGSGLWFEGESANPTLGLLRHTTIANNNGGSGQGIFVGVNTSLILTNTIIAGHYSAGITASTGSTTSLEATLWYNNGQDTSGGGNIVTGTINIDADPAFAAPSTWNYHLTSESPAIDAGVDAGVTADFDGDNRPQGTAPDIGADEYTAVLADLSINKMTHTTQVTAGEQITYTLTITNNGPDGPATASVADILTPAYAVDSISWSGGDCAATEGVITCTVSGITTATPSTLSLYVATSSTFNGTLTNTATVTGTLGTEDPNPTNNTTKPVTVTIIPSSDKCIIYLPIVLRQFQ